MYTRYATCVQFVRLKKVKVELTLWTLRWLCHNDVRPTQSNKWHRVFGEFGALPKIRKENVKMLIRNCKWFSNFSVLCECCWWKLLVRCKTLIYCGQLCNNAVNYPSTSTPLKETSQEYLDNDWVGSLLNVNLRYTWNVEPRNLVIVRWGVR
jgi:hypothetical protein